MPKDKNLWKRFWNMQESGILLATVLFMVIITCVNSVFLSLDNIWNVLRSTGFTLLTTLGITLVLISGGLDLSVGSVYALGGTVCAKCLVMGLPIWVSILAGLVCGLVIGLVNGLIIVKLSIPPLIVTLGMMYVARGVVYVLTQGVPVYPLPEAYKQLEQTSLLGAVPNVVLLALVLAVVMNVMMKRTPLGRSIYAVGGNADAARISGLNVGRVKLFVYVLTSMLAALTGILMTARLGSAQATAGSGYEMTVIAAAIIGGTSTYAGVGTIWGSVLGALFMEILSNSLTLMRISVYWQNIVIGVVLVVAVIIDTYRRTLMRRRAISAAK